MHDEYDEKWDLFSTSPPRAGGWRQRKLFRSCDHLLRRISELYEKVDPIALDIIRSWPTGYVAWKLEQMHTRAGRDNAPYSAILAQKHPNTVFTTTPVSGGQIGRV